jgi:hypothetical protein
MSGPAALVQTESSRLNQPPHRLPHRVAAEARAAPEPGNRKTQLCFPFQTAVPQEVRIDRPVGNGKAQPRDQQILKLFPHQFRIHFVFHF